jgi:hypothetical protein
MVVTPLYGHTSEATAYLVPDYPYGRKVRCRIRYWLETKPGKGVRLVSQTENPSSLRWNAPKKSTYADFAGNLYLDENGHVQWSGIGIYTGAAQVLYFIVSFLKNPDLGLLKAWVCKQVVSHRHLANGEARWTINGVPQEPTPADLERYAAELAAWEQVLSNFPSNPSSSIAP